MPPPISTIQTPKSFSSSVRIEYELASCSSTNAFAFKSQELIHFSIFEIAFDAHVTRWTLDFSLTPVMPIGSFIESCSSIVYSWGITWSIVWSDGTATALADSITASTSDCFTSLSFIPTTPSELRPLEGYVPNESISRLSDESYLPTKQTTFEVPMSKPTIRSLFFDWLFVIFQRNSCITS